MQADEDLHAGQANESGAEELESPTKKSNGSHCKGYDFYQCLHLIISK